MKLKTNYVKTNIAMIFNIAVVDAAQKMKKVKLLNRKIEIEN